MKKAICLMTSAALALTACFTAAFAAETNVQTSAGRKLISSYEEASTYSGDELMSVMTNENTYDEMGNVIHCVETTDYLNGSEPVPVIYDYEQSYNDQGLLSTQIMYLGGIQFCERSFEYDDHGNRTKMIEVNIPNTYTYVDENQYSDDGKLIGKVEYFSLSRDEIISESRTTYTYTYNDAGMLAYLEYTTEEEGMDPITNSISYEYDSAGNKTAEIQKYGNNSKSELTYTYAIAPDGSIESTDIKTISHYQDMDDVITETTITYLYKS